MRFIYRPEVLVVVLFFYSSSLRWYWFAGAFFFGADGFRVIELRESYGLEYFAMRDEGLLFFFSWKPR